MCKNWLLLMMTLNMIVCFSHQSIQHADDKFNRWMSFFNLNYVNNIICRNVCRRCFKRIHLLKEKQLQRRRCQCNPFKTLSPLYSSSASTIYQLLLQRGTLYTLPIRYINLDFDRKEQYGIHSIIYLMDRLQFHFCSKFVCVFGLSFLTVSMWE